MSMPKPLDHYKKILIIKLGAFGDFIVAMTMIRAIRMAHPYAHITLLTSKPFIGLARESGYVDAIEIDQKPKWFQITKWCNVRNWFTAQAFDRVYDLQNNDRTGLYFRIIPKSVRPEWSGAVKGASHANLSPDRTKGHALDGHIMTLSMAGIDGVEIDRLEWIKRDVSKFGLPGSYALIVAGCSPKRPEKRWPVPFFSMLCNRLVEQGTTPVLIGTRDDAETNHAIMAQCPDAIDLTGATDMLDLPVLARGAKLSIGNDTGPMHAIGITGCPSLVLFSKFSSPVKHKPVGPSVHCLQKENLADLGPDDVWEYIDKILMP